MDYSLHSNIHLLVRFDRVASQDYHLGNYHIPKGTLINVPVYPIHHDPDVWPDPEKFIPERYNLKILWLRY